MKLPIGARTAAWLMSAVALAVALTAMALVFAAVAISQQQREVEAAEDRRLPDRGDDEDDSGPVRITSIAPSAAARDELVTITGKGFGARGLRITVGTVVANVIEANGQSATFRVPFGARPGATRVVATKPGGHSASITFTVLNRVPAANAGPDQTVFVTQSVQLNGAGSSDGDGDPLTFRWSFTSRPNGSHAALSDPSAVRPTFVVDVRGPYTLQLIVNDGLADSAPDTVVIDTQNSPPMANAGADQTVVVGATVQLDGRGSSDVDGDHLTYRWSFVSRPVGSHATLTDETAPTPAFVVDLPGRYDVQLVVNDGTVDSRPDTVTIDTRNSRPVANAGADQTAFVGDTVPLDGSASSDADHDPLTWRWSFTSRPAGSVATVADVTAIQPTFVPDVAGLYVVQLIVNDGTVDSSATTVSVTADARPVNQRPVVDAGPDQTITLPGTASLNGTVTDDGLPVGSSLTIAWSKVNGPGTVIFANASLAQATASFSVAGVHVLRLTASDGALTSSDDVTVTVNAANEAPRVDAGPDETITLPAGAALSGTVTDDGLPTGSTLTIAWSTVSGPGSVTFANPNAASTTVTFSTDGQYVLRLSASDGQLSASDELTVTVNPASGGGGLPPDPRTVAPPLNPTTATDFGTGTEFLYTGANPIQTGVAPGTIEARRAAVLRGRVLTRDGAPLSGVRITVVGHPEFGQTVSRADGAFDIAVNGGGSLVISYSTVGFLPVQRTIDGIPWRDFAFAPDVMMTQLDPVVTPVDLSAAVPVQVARGSLVADADGTRRATLFFAQGTQATMVLTDGTTQPLTRLSVRATEYTVGPNGPAAMPAKLPPTSGYTYAVELSVDEALAAGATTVRFNRPVPVYVENFLSFPVGSIAPVGIYDREKGAWMSQPDGRVIKILGVTAGLADLDLTGTGAIATTAQLADLGIDDAERAQLAALYPQGTSLWRVALAHFSPCDINWSYGPPNDAQFPTENRPEPYETKSPDDPHCRNGSLIRCESQTLGETIPLAGVPHQLHYVSDRVPGYTTTSFVDIPLTVRSTLPASLQRVEVVVRLAGREFAARYAPARGLVYRLEWDGRDAYGRVLQGEQRYQVTIKYVYRAVYRRPALGGFSFPRPSGQALDVDIERGEYELSQTYTGIVGSFTNRPEVGLGGWSLTHHHHYDPANQVLYLGTGAKQRAATIGRVVTTLSDRSGPPNANDSDRFQFTAFAPDGTMYFSDQLGCRVRKRTSDGAVSTFAGVGIGGTNCGGRTEDGIPATEAMVWVGRMAVGPDGLYITDFSDGGGRIRRIGSDGIIRTVAGIGRVLASNGDGGSALAAAILPDRIVVGPDTSIYFDEFQRIRRVGPEGIIHTIAGTGGGFGASGDGGPATQASIVVRGLALAPDGSILFANDAGSAPSVRRITPDGIIRTIAGGSPCTSVDFPACGDGNQAAVARFFNVRDIALGPDGSLFVLDFSVIRQIGPDGTINTVAGLRETTNSTAYFGDGRQATATQLFPFSIAVAPDNSLLVVSDGFTFSPSCITCPALKRINAIRRLAPPSAFATTELAVPSRDGGEIYVFSREGRHLRTIDALTNAIRRSFGYDDAGRLVAITGATGLVETSIDRAGATPTAIIGAFGHRTRLANDGNGYLSTITDPAEETTQVVHDNTGLLTELVDPRGGEHRFTYDTLGRLIRDEAPGGGAITLTRTFTDRTATVAVTTAEGRTTTYKTEVLPNGDVNRVITAPSGAVTTVLRRLNGTTVTTTPDGVVDTIVLGPDPRWGLLAPIVLNQTVEQPSGLTRTITGSRSATLSNPTDFFSLATLSESASINGRTTVRSFDSATRTWTITRPTGRSITMTLDAVGRVTSHRVGALEPLAITYDGHGRVVSFGQGSRVTTVEYGADGYAASTTDPAGRTARYERDAVGRVVSQTRADGTIVRFAYDRGSNLVRLTPPGRPDHELAYTPLDRLASYAAPGAFLTRYTYNRDGQVTEEVRADNVPVDFAYDAAGRPSSTTIDSGSLTATYDAADRVTGLTAPSAFGLGLTLAWDGSLRTSDLTSGILSVAVGRTYDASFRLSSRSLNGTAIAQTYDADDLLTSVGLLSLARDAQHGLVAGTTLGTVTTAATRAGSGEATGMRAAASGVDLYVTSLDRDAVGRITSLTETIQSVTTVDEYRYDVVGRLLEVRRNGESAELYEYDGNGNRTRATVAGVTSNASYGDRDELVSRGGATFEYTAAGERASKTDAAGTTSYVYDTLSNLIGVSLPDTTQIGYLIDARGRRIGRFVNGTFVQGFAYQDRLKPIAELDGRGNVVSRFVYAQKMNVPDYMIRGGVAYRILTDHRGSPRLVVDATSGAVVQRIDYDAFGNVVQDTNPGFQPFGFAGGLYDPDTRLVHLGARDYDAETGRWITIDPVRFAGRDPNLYAYVGNDPINRVDPDGTSFLNWEDWDLSGAADFAAGFGDTLSFGLTKFIREQMGTDQFVDPCSGFYDAGKLAAYVHMLATLAAGVARVGAGAAVEASVGGADAELANLATQLQRFGPTGVTLVPTGFGNTASAIWSTTGALAGSFL